MAEANGLTKKLNFVVFIVHVVQEHYFGSKTLSRCSGCLIREDVVLTAAHCFLTPNVDPKSVSIRLMSGIKRTAHRVYIHPNYTSQGVDLAVLICPSTTLSDVVELPTKTIPDNAHCTASGFGNPAPALRCFKTIQVNRTKIISRNASINVFFRGESPCKGDSGGPLICDGTIYGILSRGTVFECGINDSIMTYEDIILHLNWIQTFLQAPIMLEQSRMGPLWLILLIVSIVVLIIVSIIYWMFFAE